MGNIIKAFDWSAHPLGNPDEWPQSLKTSVSLILNSQHPMWIGWGEQMSFLYNDAYVHVLGLAKHPWALGRPASDVWAEIWDVCGPLADRVFREGRATFVDDVRLFMNRGDFMEETYYSFSYSPIRDETGEVGGLFCPSTDVSPKVIGARRLRTLSELAASALVERTAKAACTRAIETIAQNPDDIPFALLYVVDENKPTAATLMTSAGLQDTRPSFAPAEIDLSGADAASPVGSPKRPRLSTAATMWPIAEVLRGGETRRVRVDHLVHLPPGPAGQRVQEALVLPVASGRRGKPVGVLIAGVNPTRSLEEDYRTFFELVATNIATAIQNARAAEQERARADMLAELDRAKTQFFANVSHEFRTPLTLMLGPLEAALADGSLPREAKAQLETTHRNSLRLLKLVNSLLDFSRIEAGRAKAAFQKTDLAAFTSDLASNFRSAMESAGLKLVVDCASLPESVYVDRDMWEKIVLNLLSNAFKFTFDGQVAVSLRAEGDRVVLRVSDTGTGIPEDELGRIFERFHRVEGARGRTYEGTGIGLALIKELVKLHGGTVKAASRLGEGTTFTISVPFGAAHLPQEQIVTEGGTVAGISDLGRQAVSGEAFTWSGRDRLLHAAEEEPPAGHSTGTRPRILLADDNADMREHIARILGDQYELVTAGDGEAALGKAREVRPDLILSDIMMPRLDGFGFLKSLRTDPKMVNVPFIMLSARAGEEAHAEGVDAGADDYLIKPFSARELLARIAAHLKLAKARQHANELAQAAHDEAEALNEVSRVLGSELDLQKLVQTATDIATKLTGAQFGAFFYNVLNEKGESYLLYTLSGAPREAFEKFGMMPRNTPVFHTTFSGLGPRRSDDIRKDPDYGKLAPHFGMPKGHLPVSSYLAVPVKSRSGEVLGGLFFGHPEPGIFTDSSERLATGLASYAAIAIDNARLYQKAEQEARASLLLASIVGSSDDAIISKNLDGVITSWNNSAELLFGYTAAEAIGKTVAELLIPPDRQDEEPKILARLRLGERVEHFETIRRRKDGTLLDVSLTISPMKDAQGTIVGASKIARDISEQVKARAAIESLNVQLRRELHAMTRLQQLSGRIAESGELDRLLEQVLDTAIHIVEADMGNIQLLRNGKLNIVSQSGFKAPFLDFFNSVPEGSAACGRALERRERVIVEDVSRSPIFAGTEALDVMLEAGAQGMQSTPLLSRAGQVLGMLSTHYRRPHRPSERELRLLDLLARQAADLIESILSGEALRESERQFRQLAEVGPQIVWLSGPRGELEFVNQRWIDFSGLDFEETKDPGLIAQRLHPDDRLLEYWDKSVKAGTAFELEARLRRRDGEFRWFMMRSIPIRDELGRVLRWFGTSTDIHENKILQLELKSANLDLEQFAYSASHDLQEPLRGVKLFSELLSSRYGDRLEGQALEFLGHVRENASRMEILVRDLLSYTQASTAEKSTEETDANAALQTALGNIAVAIAEAGAKIDFEPLPAVCIHPVQLQQIFQNLIGNALKYHRPGVPPIVKIAARRQNENWLFSVSDNGIGIDPAYKERIFGLFKRLHTSDEYSGTGIGLALCQRIVERNHGRIWVESEPGKGSVFCFTLPG